MAVAIPLDMRALSLLWTAALAACASGYGSTDASEYSDYPGATSDANTSGGAPDGGGGGEQTYTIRVTLTGSGTGSVTSSPTGVTCAGTMCTGTFPAGMNVTLDGVPAGGSSFAGFGGDCSGPTCDALGDEDLDVTAEFTSIDGTWSGSYTCTRPNAGCTFNNAGTFSMTVTSSGSSWTAPASINGLELRYIPGCSLCCSTASSTTGSGTLSGSTLTGSHDFYVSEAGSNLLFPWTATVSGNTMTGTWTCAGCAGGFTLTRQ